VKIVYDLPFPKYIKKKHHISNHQLNHLDECPAAFQYFLTAPADPPSPDQIEGSCFDIAMQDLDLFKQIVIRDEKRKTIAQEDANGGYILGYERYDRLLIMAENVRNHPEIKLLLRKGKFQASVFTKLEGVKVKCRPDFLPDDLPIIIDFKTTRVKPTPRNIRTEVTRWRYFQQASFYLDQLPDRKAFVFIFAPKTPPYLPTIDEPDEDTLAYGRAEYIRLLELYKRCMETGIWPGHWHVRPLSLPKCILQEEQP